MPEETEDAKNEGAEQSEAQRSTGGFGQWLPLILTVLLMPALAYVTTMFVLLPRLQKGLAATPSENSPATRNADSSSPPATAALKVNAREGGSAKPKNKVSLSKIVVNVSGSQGTRLLLTSLTLAGAAADFKTRVEDNVDQLRDLAAGILGTKSIPDLEKPESRNLIRSELLSQFNAVLGTGFVQEIYITEFAIQ